METNQSTILTYSVLVGLSPLVPVPFVDDWLKNYFRRRMVRSLAAVHQQILNKDAVNALTEEKSGCFLGCLGAVILYPLKKIFRKLFYFLEWKRAVDLTSHTYHYGYVVDFALHEGYLKSDVDNYETVRKSIDEVCKHTPIKPIETIVTSTFNQSKNLIWSGVEIMEKAFRNMTRKATDEEKKEAVKAIEEEEKEKLEGVTSKLSRAISSVPEEHFKSIRECFTTAMKTSEQLSQAERET